MALIAILLVLTLERLLGAMEGLRNYRWFDRWSGWVRGQLPAEAPWQGVVGLIILLLPPLLAGYLIIHLVAGLWAPIFFLFSVVVLLYCLGPRDLEAEAEAFIAARERDDEESAMWHATVLIGKDLPNNSHALTRQITENILTEANSRLLAVIFWFLVFGPFGAVLYRLAALVRTDEKEEAGLAEAARKLMWLLDWIPARLCALGYALSGNFVDAIQGWRETAASYRDTNHGVMIATGLGALGHVDSSSDDEEVVPEHETVRINETLALVRRMMLVYLVILALLTLAGLAS
jgi:AmpE protein